jgi:hypothetical protein
MQLKTILNRVEKHRSFVYDHTRSWLDPAMRELHIAGSMRSSGLCGALLEDRVLSGDLGASYSA